MIRNLCKKVVLKGGKLVPLMIPSKETNGTGLMNPSIYLHGENLLLNLRHVNYTLYHCEGNQVFQNRWGPLSYLNPENDRHLKTINFLCILHPDALLISNYGKIDTSKLDVEPNWEFVGLEDARLFCWDGKVYNCGVRRDIKTNGEGRMELSELDLIEEKGFVEINRFNIQPPDPSSHLEKNWMPILDMPYHFVRWAYPTEIVKVDISTLTSETVYLSKDAPPDNFDFKFRGSSQVIPYKDYRICITHELNFYRNFLLQRDGKYVHRFIVWDKQWNIIKISEPFSFLTGEIEFCCGMTLYKEDLLITFGFQDNAAYLLKVPKNMIDSILEIDNLQ